MILFDLIFSVWLRTGSNPAKMNWILSNSEKCLNIISTLILIEAEEDLVIACFRCRSAGTRYSQQAK